MNRMHPEDLRSLIAAKLRCGWSFPTGEPTAENRTVYAVQQADALLAELARTAKPEAITLVPRSQEDREAYYLGKIAEAIARAEKAEADRDAFKASLRAYEDQHRESIRQWDALEHRATKAEAERDSLKAMAGESEAHNSRQKCLLDNAELELAALKARVEELEAEVQGLKPYRYLHPGLPADLDKLRAHAAALHDALRGVINNRKTLLPAEVVEPALVVLNMSPSESLEAHDRAVAMKCAQICMAGINDLSEWDAAYWNQACENRAEAIRSAFAPKGGEA